VHDQVVGGGVAGETALSVALSVVERHHQAGPAHRLQAGLDGQLVGAVGDGGECRVGARRPAVMGVQGVHQSVTLCGEPVHRLLRITDQIDQPGGVAASDLSAVGHVVRRSQQKSGQKAHHGHT
jgi:hypothetical protein